MSALFSIKQVDGAASATDSLFRFYRTLTHFTSRHHRPQMAALKGKSYLLIPTAHSYYLYDLESLQLRFYATIRDFPAAENARHSSPRRFNKFLLDGHMVIATISSTVYWSTRGEVVHQQMVDSDIVDAIKIGELLILLINDNDRSSLVFLENDTTIDVSDEKEFCKELFRMNDGDFGGTISHIFHPHGYTNKIIIVTESKNEDCACILYNFNTRRIIFQFSISGRILDIAQTSVLDVLGFAMADGSVRIHNIKKNKEVFIIKDLVDTSLSLKTLQHVSVEFSEKLSIIILETNFILYDLLLKKVLLRKSGVLHAAFITPNLLLTTTDSSIEVHEYDDSVDDNLRLILKRSMVSGSIERIARLSEKELAVCTKKDIFKISLYRDEQNNYICKGSRYDDMQNIFNLSIDGFVALGTDRFIRVYGDNIIKSGNDYSQSCIKKIMEMRAETDWIKIHREFCLVGQGTETSLINIRSKRLVIRKEAGERIIAGDFDLDKLIIMTSTTVLAFGYDGRSKYSIELDPSLLEDSSGTTNTSVAKPSIEIISNMVIIHRNNHIQVSCGTTNRLFKAASYSIDQSCRYISTIDNKELFIHDLTTGKCIEHIIPSIPLKQAVVLDYFKFIAVLDEHNDIHLLSNQSYFNMAKKAALPAQTVGRSEMRIEQQHSSLYMDMLLEETLKKISRGKTEGISEEECDLIVKGLEPEEILDLLEKIRVAISSGRNKPLSRVLSLLKKVLLFRHGILNAEKIKEIKGMIESLWEEYQNGYLMTIGMLERISTNY